MCVHDHRGSDRSGCGCVRQALEQHPSRRSALQRIGSALAVLSAAPAFLAHAARAASGAGSAYDVVSSGKVVGSLTVAPAGLDAFSTAYEYNDRGRGPKVVGSFALAPDGTLRRQSLSGLDYLKNAIDERFALENGRAAWRNRHGERDDVAASARAFYVAFDGTPAETALLAAAALKRVDRTIPLWPAGTARATVLSTRTLSGSTRIRLVSLEGLDFAPTFLWLDDSGSLFASGSSWNATVRRGWSASLSELLAAQQTAEADRDRAIASALRPASRTLAVVGATLFDAATATTSPGRTVFIAEGTIRAVGPDADVTLPSDASRVEARGAFVMPGLWDMHHHAFPGSGIRELAQGVTTIRDPGNDPERLVAMARAYDDASALGPRIVIAGLIDGDDPMRAPIGLFVKDRQTALDAVRRYHDLGAAQIKIYSSVKPELVPVIAQEAHRLGMRVSGHIPAFMTAEQAVLAGYDEIQHTNFLYLNFLYDIVQDTRGPSRFTVVAQHAADIDLNGERVQRFVELLLAHKTVSDPTLGVFENLFVARPGDIASSGYGAIAHRLPAAVRRGLLSGGLPVPTGKDQSYRDAFAACKAMVGLLHRRGVPIVAGTDDNLPGFDLVRELELYVESGIPAAEVLQIATLGAARTMRLDDRSGSIAPGKGADLILVDGDPTLRIADLYRVRTVVKDGRAYDVARLWSQLGTAPA